MSETHSAPRGDIQVTVTILDTSSELTTDFLAQELPGGFQELGTTDSDRIQLRFFLKESELESFRLKWQRFHQDSFGVAAPAFETAFIAETDWQERFRRETKPVVVADTILVRPTWVERESCITPAIETEIVIDPKMAFGVGSHQTTKLAMCALKETLKPGHRVTENKVADIGCGSLILSILAAKLGAGYVKAVDTDPLAIENSLENRRLNQVEESVEVLHGSTERFTDEHGKYEQYDIVVANIISQILLSLLDDLLQIVKADGVLILSGIQESQSQEMQGALRSAGVKDWKKSTDGEWVAYTCSFT